MGFGVLIGVVAAGAALASTIPGCISLDPAEVNPTAPPPPPSTPSTNESSTFSGTSTAFSAHGFLEASDIPFGFFDMYGSGSAAVKLFCDKNTTYQNCRLSTGGIPVDILWDDTTTSVGWTQLESMRLAYDPDRASLSGSVDISLDVLRSAHGYMADCFSTRPAIENLYVDVSNPQLLTFDGECTEVPGDIECHYGDSVALGTFALCEYSGEAVPDVAP